MDQFYVEVLGTLAGMCTTGSFLPQAIRTWKTRSVQDISLTMYVVLVTGVALWIVYGALLGSFAILAANIVTLGLAGSVLLMKLHFSRFSPVQKKTNRKE